MAGSIVALLYAPQSGSKTRRQIRNFVDDELEEAGEFVERTKAQVKDTVTRGMNQIRESAAQVRSYVNDEVAGSKAGLCDCSKGAPPEEE